ncbi:hypothetical protein B0H14DRAFT_2592128 [Mycena olivaceomarginata]|nr:hypothetical protein B0H14DRAFT_2592128 [Mycena olivaceomarginata]
MFNLSANTCYPDHPDPQNPLLKEIFGAAIQQVAKILMDFDLSHPVVANFAEHFKSVKAAERRRCAPDWMRTISLTPTPELEAVISPPLTSLPGHSLLSHIPLSERQERVLSVGSVLLQLLAVRNELREPLNLNGDILDDLNTDRAVSYLTDGPRALSMLKFNSAHIIYDPDFLPTHLSLQGSLDLHPNYSYSGDAESKEERKREY